MPRFPGFRPARPDPVFDLMREAKMAGPKAIDATVGVILDSEGLPLLFDSVRNALEEWAARLSTRSVSYSPLLGHDDFRTTVTSLLFGAREHVASVATTGGTGAVAMNLRMLRQLRDDIRVIVPVPTWGNHLHLCASAGLEAVTVPYLADGKADIRGILAAIERESAPPALLVQAGCHNPTGIDLSAEQWKELAAAIAQRSIPVVLDMAYQGFSAEPEQDTVALTTLTDAGIPLFVSWSASKNHTIYGLRTGLACAPAADMDECRALDATYASVTRGIHSSASIPGQAIVAAVQAHGKNTWQAELRAVREDLRERRARLRLALPNSCAASLDGNGLFAILPLTLDAIQRLRAEHHVFLTDDGRINIGGISPLRIEECAKAIAAYL